jgi:predicted anti-sigma-YlaC factor YlaD
MMGDREAAQRILDDLVAEVDRPGADLDLLAQAARTVPEQEIEILVALKAEDHVLLKIQQALDAEIGLIEIAMDRGMGRPGRVEEGREVAHGVEAILAERGRGQTRQAEQQSRRGGRW